MNKIYILHDFDGRPYYKAIEDKIDIVYLNTRPFRFAIRDLVKYKKLTKDTMNSLVFLLKMPFLSGENIILAMAPFNYRIIFYGMLCFKNRVHYHTSWPFWDGHVPFEYRRPLKKMLKKIWMRLLNSFESRIAVTEGARNSLSKFLNYSVVVQIPHSVDVEIINEYDFENRISRKDVRVGFLGRLDESKGIQLFLDIYNGFRDTDAVSFYCAGKGTYSDKVISLANSNANFNYCGFISDRTQVRRFLSELDFLLVPSIRSNSWEELFGLVIIEAMSQGVVVFATDHIGPCSILEHGVDGYIFNEDIFVDSCFKYLVLEKNQFRPIALEAIKKSEKYKLDVIATQWEKNI
ncbi:glycosyltransferase family 4 protein [Vibrio vulnificus]|uniref:glycosyltransferase family 4 protein n=1 Tax=Vibrio vulnificus TaxID=672 RepID=UPI003EDA16B8